MVDTLIKGKTRDRRKFCSFYTESDPILSYMVSRLEIKDRDLILEPCAGDGAFVGKILDVYPNKDLGLELVDLNPEAIAVLKRNFGNYSNISIRQADALLDVTFDLASSSGGYYSKIIGNPPYGAWQEYEKRDLLKKKYEDYARETYTLFIRRAVDLLKNNGKLVFIIPDTFLALNLHKKLRKKLLEETNIQELLLIPSKFFPGVNFGYSNLCILTLSKKRVDASHKIKIVSVKKSVDALFALANNDYSVADNINEVKQSDILKTDGYAFLLNSDDYLRRVLTNSPLYLGDVADCVTGFYSGDNSRFIAETIDKKLIDSTPWLRPGILNGLPNGKQFVPLVKGRGNPLFNDRSYFIQWTKGAVEYYKTNKKSRFQNAEYYFKEGIGVPMVKTSKIKAFLLENRLFDQSVVGIFPKKPEHINFLLLFLNSQIANKMIHAINHTTNNSANYLKRLPIIINDEMVKASNSILEKYKKNKDFENAIIEANNLFAKFYKI